MQIVIDIPDKLYETIISDEYGVHQGCIYDIIRHGTPQQKTGHWIKYENNGIGHIECSNCLCWFLESHLLRNSYCPNCGAKMEVQNGRSN